jgi:hypothetical protein
MKERVFWSVVSTCFAIELIMGFANGELFTWLNLLYVVVAAIAAFNAFRGDRER